MSQPLIEEPLPSGFFFISKSPTSCEIAFKSGIFKNNIEIIPELHIDNHNNVSLLIGETTISPSDIGLPNNIGFCNLSPK